MVVRVLIDEPAIDREFDYLVPADWVDEVRVGSLVRVDLRGRRVRGWVVERDIEPDVGIDVRKISKVSSLGPPPAIIDLARWAADRWVGRASRFLRTASPPVNVASLPRRGRSAGPATVLDPRITAAFDHEVSVVRVGPSADDTPFGLAAAARGRALLLTPTLSAAQHLAVRLRRAGVDVALWDRDWAKSAAGVVTVGTRAAAFAPIGPLAAVVVFDEHDERYQEESSPTWHARDVAIERARRDGASCVLVSSTPSLEALEAGVLLHPDRSEERVSWPIVDVIDRRGEDPRSGEWCSPELARLVQGDRTVACIVNRTGRARLSICHQCGEVARSATGAALLAEGDEFVEVSTGQRRPVVCDRCGSTRFRRVRLGVSGVADELARLARRDVVEVTAADDELPRSAGLYVGTEALVHRLEHVDTVVFLDLDQELLAPRFRAAEQSMALIAAAARLVGPRSGGGRIALQTRLPDHHVVTAALHGDPAQVTDVERDRRREMNLPPFSAMAVVSGAVAPTFMAAFDPVGPVEIVGHDEGRWLLRAPDHLSLTAALRATPRPNGRLRIEIDPSRI
jgi:primosomal protein N' (replication factor Y) (superfamily II helicase)